MPFENLVAPPGLEPGLSALKGPRVNQLHHGAKHTHKHPTLPLCHPQMKCLNKQRKKAELVALPGLEPGFFALRGRLEKNSTSPNDALRTCK